MRRILSKITRRIFPPSETLQGYEHPELVDSIFRKTVAYQPSNISYEFAGARTVLDFGGGCGLHFKQYDNTFVRWAVVETPEMVRRASELQTDRLHFFRSIEQAAAWLGEIEVVHSDGAIQYTGNPIAIVRELCGLRAQEMKWRRLFLGDYSKQDQTSHLGENGPGFAVTPNKLVRFERTSIPETVFLAAHEGYTISSRGPDWINYSLM